MKVTFIPEHAPDARLTVETTLAPVMWPQRFRLALSTRELEQLVGLLDQETKLGPLIIETDDTVYEHCIMVGGGPAFEYRTKRAR
jgi:hypothetical protein